MVLYISSIFGDQVAIYFSKLIDLLFSKRPAATFDYFLCVLASFLDLACLEGSNIRHLLWCHTRLEKHCILTVSSDQKNMKFLCYCYLIISVHAMFTKLKSILGKPQEMFHQPNYENYCCRYCQIIFSFTLLEPAFKILIF